MPLALIAPALLLASIAGAAALLGAAILWARNRQRRHSRAASQDRQKADSR
jgi:uncharacterized iron-regulated membrane protein